MTSFLRSSALGALALVSVAACSADGANGTEDAASDISATTPASPLASIKTVFVIVMENHSWSTIRGAGDSARYINEKLVRMGAHAEHYTTPPNNHPSEPNYIWMEAGDNLGIASDDPPAKNHRHTSDHLTTQLEAKNISWKAYAEDIAGDVCPLTKTGSFDPKHTPQLFFDDVTGTNDTHNQHCIDHVRPYKELASDLGSGTVARYNFITPNLCNDMHGEVSFSCPFVISDLVERGDKWLENEIPRIMASAAYQDHGAIFVVWDEGDESLFSEASDGPIPMIVLSPLAKPGFASMTPYTHSSLFRTFQTIFDVPFLAGAKSSNDLSEMFVAP